MSNPIPQLNNILSEELDFFFDENKSKLRPWNSDEWETNRKEVLEEKCEWCGDSDSPLHIHHQDSGPNWGEKWIIATDRAFAKSSSFKSSLVMTREECPNCGRKDYYPRKTKEPEYRCNSCHEEFSEPRFVDEKEIVSNEEYKTSNFVKSGYYKQKLQWLQSNRDAARTEFETMFEQVMDEYIEMVNVVTICQSCHYQHEQTSNQRCDECGVNWHSYDKEMCWDCLKDEKGLVKCECGEGWYQESKYNKCSDCR